MRRKEFLVEDPSILWPFLGEMTWGTLALLGEDGKPYALPMSHAWVDGVFLFHGARSGRKVGAMTNGSFASYSVVEALSYLPAHTQGAPRSCESTQFFRSVFAEGTMEAIIDLNEKSKLLRAYSLAFEPHLPPEALEFPAPMLNATSVWVLRPTTVTGKFKLGQNLGDEQFTKVLAFLAERKDPQDAKTIALMKQYRSMRSVD